MTQFDDYYSPRKNTLFERFKKNCEYTESTDTMVRDHRVFGFRDAKVQSQFLCIDVDKLTLEKALSHCRSAEVTESQLKAIWSQSTEKQVLAVLKVLNNLMGLTFIASSMVAGMVLNSALRSGKRVLSAMEGVILLKCAVSALGKYKVAASVVPLDNCPQDARNDEGVETELAPSWRLGD